MTTTKADSDLFPWVEDLDGTWHHRPAGEPWATDRPDLANALTTCGRWVPSVRTSEEKPDNRLCPNCIGKAVANGGIKLRPGDKIRFFEDSPRTRYRVRAVSRDGRYAICTRPFNLQHTVIYTIVDFQRGVRGPDNRVFSEGYETDEQIATNLAALESGALEVSWRTSRFLPLDIAQVWPAPSPAEGNTTPEVTG